MELTLAGKNYKTGRLDVFVQGNVARKLMPVVATLGVAARDVLTMAPPPVAVVNEAEPEASAAGAVEMTEAAFGNLMAGMAGPMAMVIAEMPDKHWNFILMSCLAVCERQVDAPGQGWGRVLSSNGRMQYDDIQLPEMMQLVFAVIRENLGNFFQDPPTKT